MTPPFYRLFAVAVARLKRDSRFSLACLDPDFLDTALTDAFMTFEKVRGEKYPDVADSPAALPLIHRFVVNAAYDLSGKEAKHHRKRSGDIDPEELRALPEPSPEVQWVSDEGQSLAEVAKRVGTPGELAVFELRMIGNSSKQIGAALGIPTNTVDVLFSRLKNKLKEALLEADSEPVSTSDEAKPDHVAYPEPE